MSKAPQVTVMRLKNSVSNGATEYLIGIKGKGGYTDLLRAIMTLVPAERLINTAQGPQKIMESVKRWEYFTDDYFSDHEVKVESSAILMSRDLEQDEELYDQYLEALDAYKTQLAEVEAQKLLTEKTNEIKEAKMNRSQRRASKKTTSKAAKKTAKKTSSKRATH